MCGEFYSDGVFALSEGVPQLDRAVPRCRDDLTVVTGESNRKNILGVAFKPTGRLTPAQNCIDELN